MSSPSETTPAHAAIVEAFDTLRTFLSESENTRLIEQVADRLAQCFSSGHKVLICGNGGSSADAMHFAEELTGRFRKERPPLAAIACTDPGHLTCVANDYGYAQVFARWVSALGKPGDLLIVLSTSGESANCVEAVAAARQLEINVIGLLGKTGGKLAGMCDSQWIVPGAQADRIQEIHMLILHTLIECVERRLFPDLYR